MAKRPLVIAALLILLALVRSGQAAPAPIQAQGSSPYCLFAVDAYLAGVDMWQLEAEYHRRQLPVWPGTVIPKNPNILELATALYGTRWQVQPYQDLAAARAAVVAGHPTAFTGQGHAIVVIGWRRGVVTYLDSLHPERPQTQSEAALQAWWDGWAWYAE
jgi:hypothetical protein